MTAFILEWEEPYTKTVQSRVEIIGTRSFTWYTRMELRLLGSLLTNRLVTHAAEPEIYPMAGRHTCRPPITLDLITGQFLYVYTHRHGAISI